MADQLGAKLAPRLADVMSRAIVDTTSRLTPHKVRGSMQLQESFFRLVASEVHGTVAGLTRELATDTDIAPWLQDTLKFMAHGTGQWATILNMTGIGTGLSGGFGGLIENEMRPVVEKRFAANPNAVHDPGILAGLVAKQIITKAVGRKEANKSAVSETRFDQLVDAAEQLPAFGEIIALIQRGVMSVDTGLSILYRAGMRPTFAKNVLELRWNPLTPEELANLVDRGEISQASGRDIAHQSGIKGADFDLMVKLVGVPPATEVLLMAYRRGIIDRARLDRGIRQSPLRSEWIDVVSELQYDPILTTQAADAVSQNLMSKEKGRSIAADNGMRAADFDLLVETAGRPPGIEQVLELWNRGETTEAEVRQALLESSLKNKWVPLLMKTRRRIPPQDTVRMLINRGVITPAQGIKKFMATGYDADDAAAFATLAQHDKTEADRDLTKAEIVSLYEYRLVTDAAARAMLGELGYDEDEQAFILSLADFRKSKREMDAAASVIRSKYVARKITDSECSMYLDQLHVPADARDHLMDMWKWEREANQKELTPAEIISMTSAQLFTRVEAQGRLEAIGYSAGDANLKLTLKFGPTGP